MKRSILVAIGVVVVIAVIVLVFIHPANKTASTTTPASTNSSATASKTTAAAVITYSNGFSPQSTTVKSGDNVTFTNNSSQEIQVDSDPHPVHTDDTDLNVGQISPGQSKTVTLTKKGSFGFHNHLNPSNMARITIQ